MKIIATKDHADWSTVKIKRNALLKSSDPYMILDFPVSEEDREKVKVYRQQLRQLFENVTHPDLVVFPEWPI